LEEVMVLRASILRGDVPAAGVLGTDSAETRAGKLVSYVTELEALGEQNDERVRKILWDRDPSPLRRDTQFSIEELLRAAHQLGPIQGEKGTTTLKAVLRLAWFKRARQQIIRPVSGAPASRLRRLSVELFRLKSPYVETAWLLWAQEHPKVKEPISPRQVWEMLKAKKRFLRTLARSYSEVTGESAPHVPGFLSKEIPERSQVERHP
jgi:hypothetical protein